MKKFLWLFIGVLMLTGCPSKKVEVKEAPVEEIKEKTIVDYINIEGSHSGYIFKDGRKLYIARKENAAQIYLESSCGKDVKQLTFQEDAVEGYVVSPEEKQILYIISKGGNEQYDFHVYNLEKGNSEGLLVDDAVRFESPRWLNENELMFTSNEANGKDFYIYHLDIPSKKKTLLVEKPGYNHITDAISKDEFLFYTFLGNNKTAPYHFKNGKPKKIKGAQKERNFVPLAFFEDGILMETNEESDVEYLEIWKDGVKKPLFKDIWGVESVVVDKISRKHAAFCTNEDGYSSCSYYSDGKVEQIPLKKSVVFLTRIDGERIIYNMMNPDRISSPAAFHFSRKESVSFGYTFDNGVDISGFAAPELKKVKGADGVEIPYFLYTPKTGKPPFNTIVYFHGGPEGQFRPYFIATYQYYLKKGFAIVAPNVRGSSGYGQIFMDMDNYKLRMNSVSDGKTVTDELVRLGISKPGKFIAMGGSYGGFMVVASMAKFSDDYHCGINSVGVVDFVNFLENTAGYRRHLREVEYGPLTDREFLMSISPTNMVDTIKGELFVFHGANDPRVPVSDAYILMEKMKKAGKKYQHHIFEDEGHGFKKRENRVIYNSKSAEFIEKCGE
ncbi:MAG TPA: S9 family peptidase [bacterium]|nr:S9 family peptidase [bacterium]